MSQTTLPLDPRAQRIVNVATVPLRSPFRYPGGKTWLVPRIREWLASCGAPVKQFVEPFAGGGIATLTVIFEGLAEQATMVELDEDVAPVWTAILNGSGEWLAKRIVEFDLTPEGVDQVLGEENKATRDKAFETILRNRINRGGILAPGAGRVKEGENGKGIASRWYPETISRRIREIVAVKKRINFVHGDGVAVMRVMADDPDAVFFIDPPYTVAGRRLYQYNEVDHAALFVAASKLRGDFLMTYDDAVEIRDLAARHGFQIRETMMKTTHHSHKVELLIGRRLDWFTP